MARRSYKFTSRTHSKKGIIASIMALISFVVLGVSIQIAYANKGEGTVYLGSAGLAAMFIALFAMFLAASDLRGEQTFKAFAWIGTILSVLAFGIWGMIYISGFAM